MQIYIIRYKFDRTNRFLHPENICLDTKIISLSELAWKLHHYFKLGGHLVRHLKFKKANGDQSDFSIWNHHKCLSYLFPLHGVMAIKNILILIVRGLTLDVRNWRLSHVEVYTHRIWVQLYEKCKKMMLGAYNKVFWKIGVLPLDYWFFRINHGDQSDFFPIINVLVTSFRFIWKPMLWSMANKNILILTVRGLTLDVRIWRLQTSDFDV